MHCNACVPLLLAHQARDDANCVSMRSQTCSSTFFIPLLRDTSIRGNLTVDLVAIKSKYLLNVTQLGVVTLCLGGRQLSGSFGGIFHF